MRPDVIPARMHIAAVSAVAKNLKGEGSRGNQSNCSASRSAERHTQEQPQWRSASSLPGVGAREREIDRDRGTRERKREMGWGKRELGRGKREREREERGNLVQKKKAKH